MDWTKETAKTQLERLHGDGCVWSLVHDEEMVSARKRRQQGKQPLDEETMCPKRGLDKDRGRTLVDRRHSSKRAESGRILVRTSICELTVCSELLETMQRLFWNS